MEVDSISTSGNPQIKALEAKVASMEGLISKLTTCMEGLSTKLDKASVTQTTPPGKKQFQFTTDGKPICAYPKCGKVGHTQRQCRLKQSHLARTQQANQGNQVNPDHQGSVVRVNR